MKMKEKEREKSKRDEWENFLLGTILKWTKEEPRQMDQRTRKLMIMHKALHRRNHVDKL